VCADQACDSIPSLPGVESRVLLFLHQGHGSVTWNAAPTQDRLGVVLFSPFFRPHCRGFCRHSLRSCTSLRPHAQGSLFPTTRVLPFVSRFDLLPRARSRARDSPPSSSISLAASVVRLDLTVSKLDLFSGIVIELLDQKV
jgi:hypothetical protein